MIGDARPTSATVISKLLGTRRWVEVTSDSATVEDIATRSSIRSSIALHASSIHKLSSFLTADGAFICYLCSTSFSVPLLVTILLLFVIICNLNNIHIPIHYNQLLT